VDADEWLESGKQAMMKGRIEEAIAAYDQATSLEPSSFEAWWALANACNLLGSQIEGEGDHVRANLYKMKAAYSFDRATRADPTDPRVTKAKAYATTIREVQKRRRKWESSKMVAAPISNVTVYQIRRRAFQHNPLKIENHQSLACVNAKMLGPSTRRMQYQPHWQH
jgi:tetratricopeptide (TPR) repeat protein